MEAFALSDLPLASQTAASRRTLASGQMLLQQGDPADCVYWVASGQIRLASFVNQRTITHFFVEAGELLAETALYLDTYACTAIAETVAEVVAIPVAVFAAELRQSPAFNERYLAYLTLRFQGVKTLLELRSISSARDRLLHYLFQRRGDSPDTVVLTKPLRAIASELALTPEGLSRLLARVEADGIITRKQRSITFSAEWLASVNEWYELDPS